MLYPLKFRPLYKERIWGGDLLAHSLGKKSLPKDKIVGESWELCGMPGDSSVVSNGALRGNSLSELVEIYMGDLVGEGVYDLFGDEFPLLFKFIDAQQNLSIQVHPGDEVAMERHGSMGKTEMWYVVDAEPGAQIMLGFERSVTADQYRQALEQGKVDELITRFDVTPGQTFYIPSGAVHAICKGVLVAEIQQTSDITYRIFDWNRVDDNGNPRELHTAQALDVIDFSHHSPEYYLTQPQQILNSTSTLRNCKYFNSSITVLDGTLELERQYEMVDSFVVYLCIEGSLVIKINGQPDTTIERGETVLIPAVFNLVALSGSGKIIETYIDSALFE